MFGFLRRKKVEPPRIGVELGLERLVAVVLDSEQNIVGRQEQPAPGEDEDWSPTLEALFEGLPVRDSHLVVSLTHDYHLKTLELPQVDLDTIRREASCYLPYSVEEASFAWLPLNARRATVVAYPTELLEQLTGLTRGLGSSTLHFEAPEIAQHRLLEDAGLPGGLIEVLDDTLVATLASEEDFLTLRQDRSLTNLEAFVMLALDVWNKRGQPEPRHLLTNASPNYLANLARLEALELPADSIPIYLAQSVDGPQRFSA